MKQQFFTKNILLVLAASIILLCPGPAGAEDTSLQYKLDKKYSGASPESNAPWLTAVFNNNEANDKDPNKVLLTMSAHSLTGSEGVLIWCFNFTLDARDLTFSHVSGPAATEIKRHSKFSAGGGGYFGFQFIFADDEFGPGETSVYELSYTSPLTSENFSALSLPGGGRGLYGSAALINDITGEKKLSGWIGDPGKGTATGPDS